MKIQWLGHSAFLITSESGLRIITDPYITPMPTLTYDPINEYADIVTVSHGHRDHSHLGDVSGSPEVIREAGTHQVRGIEFKGYVSSHDKVCGSERGANIIFCFSVDGVKVCHSGDLGHQLSEELYIQIGEVDVLLMTTGGGGFTIGPEEAHQVCERMKPRVVIPMHYLTIKRTGPTVKVDEFIKLRTNVKIMDTSEVEFFSGQLPRPIETVVLLHAR